jgi:hypothetical protein
MNHYIAKAFVGVIVNLASKITIADTSHLQFFTDIVTMIMEPCITLQLRALCGRMGLYVEFLYEIVPYNTGSVSLLALQFTNHFFVCRSLQRALGNKLYLLIYGSAYGTPDGKLVWHFPEKVYENEETMRLVCISGSSFITCITSFYVQL